MAGCVLACGAQWGGDEAEHYPECPVVRAFAARFLRLQYPACRWRDVWLAVAPELDDDVALTRVGILVYATWRTTESIRRSPVPLADRPATVQRMLEQAAREAVRGHPRSSRVLDAGDAPSRFGLLV